jgi:hypothetical protein
MHLHLHLASQPQRSRLATIAAVSTILGLVFMALTWAGVSQNRL